MHGSNRKAATVCARHDDQGAACLPSVGKGLGLRRVANRNKERRFLMNHRALTGSLAISAVLFLTTVCSLSRPAKAQTVNGGFHGTVSDSTGAVLPGATVEAKNLATNAVRQAESDDTGFYTLVQLPPGNYTLTASKAGFAT